MSLTSLERKFTEKEFDNLCQIITDIEVYAKNVRHIQRVDIFKAVGNLLSNNGRQEVAIIRENCLEHKTVVYELYYEYPETMATKYHCNGLEKLLRNYYPPNKKFFFIEISKFVQQLGDNDSTVEKLYSIDTRELSHTVSTSPTNVWEDEYFYKMYINIISDNVTETETYEGTLFNLMEQQKQIKDQERQKTDEEIIKQIREQYVSNGEE